MDEDKRAEPRFKFTEPVSYVLGEVNFRGSVAGNISLSGLCLKVQEFVPMGSILELQMHLGQSPEVLWAKAQVVRMREILSEDCFEIGLKFVEDEYIKKAIGGYINTFLFKSTT